jgi:CUB/sushi domain-containing protein
MSARHHFGARSLLLLALVAGLSAASCGAIKIPDGALACGSGKAPCPAGFDCLPDNRCHLKGSQKADGGPGDGKVDHPADTSGDVPAGEGGGTPCPALDNPMGGTVSASNSTAVYSCTVGNKLGGEATRTCQGDGTWSGTAPTCSPNDCGPLTSPTNGMVMAPMTTLGSVATYSCNPGLGPSGSSTRTCQADGWDGMQPTCVVANCPALPGPMGGSVLAPMLTFGATATYSCGSGFTMAGVTTRTCQPDGTWSDAAPTCTIKDCGALTKPMNGAVTTSGGTTYRATASYTCDMGYSVSGAASVTCQADGTWSAAAPTCLPKDCGALTAPANGNVAATVTTFGSSATYSCKMGYLLGGGATRTCGADGMWSGAAPTCTLADCGALTPPANGSVSAPKTTYNEVATYSCMMGFGPSGSATRTCQATGMWDGVAPTCVVANCPALSSPAGGGVSAPTLTFGSTATYSCNTGYAMTGTATRMCQSPGTWTGAAPTCTIKDCGALTAPTDGTLTATTTTYGSTATYACKTGYAASGSVNRTCQADGTWSGTTPTCAIKNCGALTGPTNGSVTATVTTYGSTGTYACNAGYNVTGAATRSCQADGTWSGTAPTCAPKDCGGLTAPANGGVSAPVTTFGSTATYSCMMGYGPSGSATRTCQADGTWSGTAPTCVIANCSALSNPAGGSVSAPTLTYGSTATYTCNNGYTLNGTPTRTCQANATWSGAAPTCDPKDCGAPPTPTHGSVSAPKTTLGQVATYSCSSGYTLSGAMTRTCQADQTWSASTPTCVPVDCGNISVANGSVTYSSGTTFGSAASYTCNTNYQLSGTSPVTCTANATWSGAPTCVDICSVAGNHGTTTHCCDSAACTSGSAPTCNTGTRLCVATPNGGSCTPTTSCASGFCVNGICCSTACNGTCDGNTCAGGTCEHASRAGVSCGTRTFNQPDYNDIELRCDSAGACKGPTIRCGGNSCDLTSKICCMTSAAGDPLVISCVASQASCQCGAGGPCGPQQDQRWYGCKSDVDCPNGMVCSAYLNSLGNYGLQYTGCFPPNGWPGGGNTFNNNFICDPTKADQCPGTPTCHNNDNGNETGYCN